MKFDLKHLSLAGAAGLVLGFGASGFLGSAAGAVVSYDAHAKSLVQLQYSEADPTVTKSDMAPIVQYAVDSFNSLDSSAKDAYNRLKAPARPVTKTP